MIFFNKRKKVETKNNVVYLDNEPTYNVSLLESDLGVITSWFFKAKNNNDVGEIDKEVFDKILMQSKKQS